MRIRVGYELEFECQQPTPMILTLTVHHSHAADLIAPDRLTTQPLVPTSSYRDGFGNWCTRIVAPAGRLRLAATGLLNHDGQPELRADAVCQHAVEELPDASLVFLLGSRYCETDRLATRAWELFGHQATGAARVYAICDFVHRHITFDYQAARPTRTAWEAYHERTGVCRDFAHLAITFCRCLNIPARYCTGYLGDIGVMPSADPMDFAAWFEAYIGGRWHVFDARNNQQRIGRVLIGRGRDATDVPMTNAFGANTLVGFSVHADDVTARERRG
jgi:transglutaminase-like putative cysteine protease